MFYAYEKRKFDENELNLSEKFILCPICKLTVQCYECSKPAKYIDVYSEPKCAEHDVSFLI